MRPTTAACLLTVTGSACAQPPGVATYSIVFGSPTGPNTVVLAPGETVDVFVNVGFSPGVGQTTGGYTVQGLDCGKFSITGLGGGAGTWTVQPNVFSPTSSLPNPWGAQAAGGLGVSVGTPAANSLGGVVWGYGLWILGTHPFPQNPANVSRGTFTASSAGTVNLSFTNMDETTVWGTSAVPTLLSYASQGVPAQITIDACYPDCDHSGALTLADFACFQTKFVAGNSYADCDQSGVLTIGDFGCFQTKFIAGCP